MRAGRIAFATTAASFAAVVLSFIATLVLMDIGGNFWILQHPLVGATLWLFVTAAVLAAARGLLSLYEGGGPERFRRFVFAASIGGWLVGSATAVAALIWIATTV